ncbi:MAG: lamin tail domain-containing protein [Methylophilus sp.]|nr:lamin tail domain-containing protein [Methylophilus sp.]
MKNTLPHMIAALIATVSFQANAAIAITEVAPWGSGDAPYEADWFELTNTGNSAIDISGWKVDDSSNAFATALALNGVTNIGAGQSVIFIESAGGAKIPSFIETWFGSNAAPLIGYYSGSGIGLSTGGDAVNIFNAAGVRQAFVSFGAADSVSPFQTFDNAAGINGVISQLSVVGVNGAFVAANDALEIGSPGTIAAVPEPESYAMLLAGLGLIGVASRKRLSK